MKNVLVVVLLVFMVSAGIWVAQGDSLPFGWGQDGTTSADGNPRRGAVDPQIKGASERLAVLDYDLLPEASGLAVSGVKPDRLWLINDSGGRSELVALDLDRQTFTRVNILDTPNRDWEDLETFDYQGSPWVVIADVGDNKARRKSVQLYFLTEPTVGQQKARVQSAISLSYPDGPRDVESVAVDSLTNTLYILSKRDPFPRLYTLALPDLGAGQLYELKPTLLGEVKSIPAPTPSELKRFKRYGEHRAQPTGMSHVPDGSGIALLTYGGTYFAPLDAQRNWLGALNDALCAIRRPELQQAEGIAADRTGRIYVTSEGKEAPLLRLTPQSECYLQAASG